MQLDLDGDGRVSESEIEKVLKANKQDAKKFIAEVDVDQDGTVSYSEFRAMFEHRMDQLR